MIMARSVSMRTPFLWQSYWRHWGIVVLALALGLRLLIAPGFMPVFNDGSITISMCTGQGAIDVKMPGKKPLAPQQGECAYAGLSGVPTFGEVPQIDLLALVQTPLPALTPAYARPHIGAAAPPPPATGPPSLI